MTNTQKNKTKKPQNIVKPPKNQNNKCKDKKRLVWIIIGSVLGVAVTISLIILFIVNKKNHEQAVKDYTRAWNEYAEAQNDFGYDFGLILGEVGFVIDENSDYNLSSSIINKLSRSCANKVNIYNEVYSNPYVVEDKKIDEKDTAEIETAIKNLNKYTEVIKAAKNNVEECREIGQSEIEKIKAEINKKAEEEAAKQKQKEESQALYQKNVLNYDKFINDIKEGMTLGQIKSIYGDFDNQCKLSSESGGYTIYTCSPTYYSSNYWVATFSFYYNVLKSKSQTGLK